MRIDSGATSDGPQIRRSSGDVIEDALASLFVPLVTSSGATSCKRDRPQYDDDDLAVFCGRFVGLSIHPKVILDFRLGEHVAPFPRAHLLRCSRRFRLGVDVEAAVRMDRFQMAARSALGSFEKFGCAPDGDPSVFDFLERLAVRLGAVDVALLDEALALEGALPELEVDFPELRARLDALGEVPPELAPYLLEDGRFVFGPNTYTQPAAARVLRAAFEGKLCRLES